MREINIGQIITAKRKEKGVTQEELAQHLGVTKASVSKWETGQSYPDLALLPVIAAYFSVTIDQLIDYRPQMGQDEIRKLYFYLMKQFEEKPLTDVLSECDEYVKKYYSCYPLLMQIGALLINQGALLEDDAERTTVIEKAKALFIRVKEESDDPVLGRTALYMEASCSIVQRDGETALKLLESGDKGPAVTEEVLTANAYMMCGKTEDAKRSLQTGIFRNLLTLVNLLTVYLTVNKGDQSVFDEILKRAFAIADTFEMEQLHPLMVTSLYLTAAQVEMEKGNADGASLYLEKYGRIIAKDLFPVKLHGDAFFDLIEDWLEKSGLGTAAPRGERGIKESLVKGVCENPLFAPLEGRNDFELVKRQLHELLEAE